MTCCWKQTFWKQLRQYLLNKCFMFFVRCHWNRILLISSSNNVCHLCLQLCRNTRHSEGNKMCSVKMLVWNVNIIIGTLNYSPFRGVWFTQPISRFTSQLQEILTRSFVGYRCRRRHAHAHAYAHAHTQESRTARHKAHLLHRTILDVSHKHFPFHRFISLL